MRPNTLETFWNRVDQSAGPNACWPWTGSLLDDYGRFKMRGEFHLAHRLALALTLGRELRWDDEAREEACHICDNPPCCNPAHLYVGDRFDNMGDAAERGRLVSPLAAGNAAKSQCPSGHPYDEANTYHYRGARQCKECRRAANRKYHHSKRRPRRDHAASSSTTD